MSFFPWIPPDGSAHGVEIDRLLMIVHAFMAALFAVWSAYFAVTLVRYRSSRRHALPSREPRGIFLAGTAATVLVVEIFLDLFFSVPIWSKRSAGIPDEKDATVVRIVAEQFAWNVHYPGRDGVFGRTSSDKIDPFNPLGLDRGAPGARDDITLLNRLVVPAGKPVIAYLTSKDVIHSLNLPVFRVKQDAVPGLVSPVWFVPVKTTAAVRREMATEFSVAAAVATRREIELPSLETIALAEGRAYTDYLAAADLADSTGASIVSAGGALDEDAVKALRAAGIGSVRARRKAGLYAWITLREYTDSSGAPIVTAHDPLGEDAVSALLAAGIGRVEARRASRTDVWVISGRLTGPDGNEIAADGAFLDEAVITNAAAAGLHSIGVAPASPTEIACAQLCGLGHYQMRAEMLVLEPAEYERWFNEQEEAIAPPEGSGGENGTPPRDPSHQSE